MMKLKVKSGLIKRYKGIVTIYKMNFEIKNYNIVNSSMNNLLLLLYQNYFCCIRFL